MSKTLPLLMVLVGLTYGVNSISQYDPHQRIIDCSDGKDATDGCDVMLVVESLTNMTYYNISRNFRELEGYRAGFNSNGYVMPLIPPNCDISDCMEHL